MRITTCRAERLLDDDVRARWQSAWPADLEELQRRRAEWIDETWAPTAVLEGSGTFVSDDRVSPWVNSTTRPDPRLYRDHLPREAPRWFVVVDGRGRVDWQFTGDEETALLVLACRATPRGYLAHLRERGVSYLIAGDKRVDLTVALGRLRDRLGARAVIADGGGGLNGALLRAGLVDELHVITFPALVGGLGTPSVFDGPPLEPGQCPQRLSCRHVEQGSDGSLWIHYEVVRAT